MQTAKSTSIAGNRLYPNIRVCMSVLNSWNIQFRFYIWHFPCHANWFLPSNIHIEIYMFTIESKNHHIACTLLSGAKSRII